MNAAKHQARNAIDVNRRREGWDKGNNTGLQELVLIFQQNYLQAHQSYTTGS